MMAPKKMSVHWKVLIILYILSVAVAVVSVSLNTLSILNDSETLLLLMVAYEALLLSYYIFTRVVNEREEFINRAK